MIAIRRIGEAQAAKRNAPHQPDQQTVWGATHKGYPVSEAHIHIHAGDVPRMCRNETPSTFTYIDFGGSVRLFLDDVEVAQQLAIQAAKAAAWLSQNGVASSAPVPVIDVASAAPVPLQDREVSW